MNTQSSDTQSLSKPVRKKRLWPKVLIGIMILICGIVIGAGSTMIFVGRTVRTIFEHPEDLPEIMTRRMKHQLDLTDNQAVEVEQILDMRIGNVMEIMRQVTPQLHAEFRSMHDEISEILTEEQRKTWKKRFSHFKKLLPPEEEEDNGTKDDSGE